MATMTIRNIDDSLKAKLRIRAAIQGRSMEEEVRDILRTALSTTESQPKSLATFIRSKVQTFGGVNLEEPVRKTISDPIKF